jgi:NADPH:quinone reductase-like Zn-dependent oxidoreductase
LKAIILKKFGGPEVLRFEDLPQPKPAAGEALIKIHSVSVNRTLDCVVRAGKYPVNIRLPHVLGADPAGEVRSRSRSRDAQRRGPGRRNLGTAL